MIINKVRESEPGVGFDALNEEYVNMVESGILDPAKVTRSALQTQQVLHYFMIQQSLLLQPLRKILLQCRQEILEWE